MRTKRVGNFLFAKKSINIERKNECEKSIYGKVSMLLTYLKVSSFVCAKNCVSETKEKEILEHTKPQTIDSETIKYRRERKEEKSFKILFRKIKRKIETKISRSIIGEVRLE
jgi:hypothetical protein